MQYIYQFVEALFELTNEMSFWLLIGFLFAGILNVLISKSVIHKYLGKNDFKSVLNATLLGIPLPLCSCGVIPTGVAFHKNGASKSASVSFLISTPQTGVDSIMVTYSLLKNIKYSDIKSLQRLILIYMQTYSQYQDKTRALNFVRV